MARYEADSYQSDNYGGGGRSVCNTIIASLHKAGVANILTLNPINQHYTAFLVIHETDPEIVIDEADSDKPL